ncbi:MAG: tetratricopeptide repeat protein [Crinalium sp.]
MSILYDMNLSLCMIVKNEEATLPQCLNSVKDVVDEMVVLDTGSSDRTPEIALNLGAKVYHFPWGNDFAAARNESLKYVQGKWVLVLDADEVLVPEIVPQIQQVIKSDRHILINLVRQEVGASQSPYSLVSRLFRNHPDVRFSRPYHAMVDDHVQALLQRESQWEVGYLPDVAMLHYGYQPGAIASRDKLNKARTTMEGFLATHPHDPYVCSKLGGLYIDLGEVDRAIELLQRGLTANTLDVSVLYELHYHLGNAYTHLQDINQAVLHYQAAIQQPVLPILKLDAYNNLGNLLKAAGDLTNARKAYEIALQIDPNFTIGYYNLGMTLRAMGFFEDAIAVYRKAIAINPNYAEAYQNLGVVLLQSGNVAESIAAFRNAIVLHQQHNPEEAQRLLNDPLLSALLTN